MELENTIIKENEKEKTKDEAKLEQKMKKKLEKEYDSLTSDEAVKETLIDNDYKFDEEGNLV